MKPKIALTSPKYEIEHPVAKLYANDQAKLQQPARGMGWGANFILTLIIGIIAGAGGMIGANYLYQHHSGWPVWRWVGLPLPGDPDQRVIIRETAPVDRTSADQEIVFDRISGALVALFTAPSESADVANIGQPFSAESYRGTGLIVTNDGVIAFDSSVLTDTGEKLVAVTSDGKSYPMSSIVRDPLSSLGFGSIDGEQFSIAAFGVEADLSVGQPLFEIRVDPLLGKPSFFERSLIAKSTRPIAQRGQVESSDAITRYLWVESVGEPAAGGSVIIDQRGSVLGMRLGSIESQLAFPIAQIRSALESYAAHQEIERAKFGAWTYDIKTAPGISIEAIGERKSGALLVNGPSGESAVLSDGPAEAAGLQVGDLVISVEGKAIDATHALSDLVQSFDVGQTVSVNYIRDGSEQTVNLTLGKLQ